MPCPDCALTIKFLNAVADGVFIIKTYKDGESHDRENTQWNKPDFLLPNCEHGKKLIRIINAEFSKLSQENREVLE